MQHRRLKIKMVSLEKQKHSQAPQNLQLRPHTQFAVGSEVEVSSDEEGFRGAWFLAKVLSSPSKAHKNKYHVEYKTLLSDENGSEPLTEYLDPVFVRPPLPVEEGDEVPFEVSDVVEAYHCDGWWTGIVIEVLEERKYRVFFQNPPDEIEFERSSLRFHKDWVDGKWVRPEKQRMIELMLTHGTAVEINLDAQDAPDIWYPGTVVKEIGKSYFLVEYRSSNETELLKAVVDSLHIRPSPPRCNNNAFQLLDKVDAYYNFGWSSGIVTKVLADGRYIVFFKRTRKEKELSHTDLRVPMSEIDGKWVHSLQDAANTQEHLDANLNDNGKISSPPENSGGMKANREELTNDQVEQAEQQAEHSEKPDHNTKTGTRVGIKQVKNDSSRGRSSKKLNKEAVPEAQDPPEAFKTKTAPLEELNDRLAGSLETPTSNMEGITFRGQSTSSGRELEAEGKELDYPTTKRTLYRGRRGRGRGRSRGSVFRSPRTPVAGVASARKRVKECMLAPPEKQVIISLPCNIGQPSRLLAQSASQLSVEKVKGAMEKKTALDKDVICVNAVNGGNSESRELRAEGTPLKKKRGRPFGSLSGFTSEDKIEEIGGTRKSTRERRAVYESAMQTLKGKAKKRKMTTEILSSTQESEVNLKQKAEAVSTNRVTQNPEPVSHGASGNVSDDDKPLSSWFGETHSPSMVDCINTNPAGNVCQNIEGEAGNHVSKQALEGNTTATRGNYVDAAQTATQCEDDTGQRAGEEVIPTPMESLPFTKTSPIWKMIESMEVFQQIPQNPHFLPLYETKEHCREGLAIGSMVTFAGLLEKISKFKCGEPRSILEGSMDTLSDLERQGFIVEQIRNRLKELLSIKSRHENSQTTSEELGSQIAEQQREKVKVDEEINEIDKKIAELKQQRELAVLQRDATDSEIAGLQSTMDSMKEALEDARAKFERLATAPW